jgi:predicted aldo/keto reductase-like oxidoreductase
VIYRALGKTGLMVSQLGFGAMRLPMVGEGENARVDREKATPMIHAAFRAGVNYIDSAVMYCNHDSQRAVGDALKAWGKRDEIVVATKNHYYGESEADWFKNLEDSLARLQVDAIDVYHHHGVNRNSFKDVVLPRLGKWMHKAVAQGLVKHIACSFHDNCDALMGILDADYAEVFTVQYNMLDRQLEPAIAKAHARGVGIVVMGPVAGGRLGVDSNEVFANLLPAVKRVPELALRFVLANDHATVALSGMSTLQQVTENCAIAADTIALSAADRAAIDTHLAKLKAMADLYCTGCNYCKPCPNNVDIPGIFSRYNQARVYGFWDQAKRAYGELVKKNIAADVCVQCGECEPKCPQHLHIRDQLQEAHAALAG